MKPSTLFIIIVLQIPATTCLLADGSDTKPIDFARQILPILSDKCFVCHGPDAAEHGDDMRRLDSFKAATAALESGKAIDPDAPQSSLVLNRIHSADDPMPPADSEKQLSAAERTLLSEWIKQGGSYAKHWAFVPPQKTATEFEDGTAAIDSFVHQNITNAGIDFAPEADRSTLARRASLILTGLPPAPDQLAAFLNSNSDRAYEDYVEQLLASPGFGEHQARYWLDAVRYGDTHGLHLDNKRGIYPYRDWVVQAFNQNLPFDDFITWQLAGDLLPNPTLAQKVATGFIRMNPSTSEGGAIPDEFQAKNNFDRTETIGTVLLGMSFTCARCHTHKYDPILHTEYYQLLAFFNSTAESPMDGNKYEYGPVIKAPTDLDGWNKWTQLETQRDALLTKAEQVLPATITAQWNSSSKEDRLKLASKTDGPFAASDLQTSAAELTQRMDEASAKFTTTLVAQELSQPRTTKVLSRGEYNLPIGEALQPATPAVMGAFPENAPANRLGLAQWLTSPEQPLTSRVLTNRIWQQVFGNGLVRTPEDFGVQGQQPTHPELLDWLSVEFQDSGWNLKHMLRMMLYSRTFKQSSTWRTDVEDPENRLFARSASYRLDAEVLRDIGLWSSKLLDPHMGGEGVKPYQPAGMWLAMAHPASNTKQYERDKGQRLYRRSLYVYWKRTSPHPMMTLFDAPDRETSCVRRSRTNTSLQSLGLLNETQRIEMSRKLAERLLTECDNDSARLDLLYTLLASRKPSPTERSACENLLDTMKTRYAASENDAAELLATGEAPVEPSLNAVEVAAWSQVVTTVLASDAAILLY